VGVVVRDHHGNILLSAWRTLHHCGTPEEAKVEALLEGIRLATEWIRKLPVYAETDCLNLVMALCGGGVDHNQWAGIISKILGLSRLLSDCTFQHVSKEANRVAH
jgi:hypothetical protein